MVDDGNMKVFCVGQYKEICMYPYALVSHSRHHIHKVEVNVAYFNIAIHSRNTRICNHKSSHDENKNIEKCNCYMP